MTYRKYWDQLVENYGHVCFYCHDEIAVCIDHVIPYSYDQDNSIENLVPSCALCNLIASDKHFEDVEHKKEYILSKRKSKNFRRAICIDCLLPFAYRYHSPSFLLCAECYDKEYFSQHSKTDEWGNWLNELEYAGIIVEAHRSAVLIVGRHSDKTHDKFMAMLIQHYEDEDTIIREHRGIYQTSPIMDDKRRQDIVNVNKSLLTEKSTRKTKGYG